MELAPSQSYYHEFYNYRFTKNFQFTNKYRLPDGDLIYCAEPQSGSLKVFDGQSKEVGDVKGHPDCINHINTVPGE